jgi:hypothetical protein
VPIIRITKAQIEKGNKARQAALRKIPEYQLYAERQQLLRQVASQQVTQAEDASNARKAPTPNDSDCRPCDEHQQARRDGSTRQAERRS